MTKLEGELKVLEFKILKLIKQADWDLPYEQRTSRENYTGFSFSLMEAGDLILMYEAKVQELTRQNEGHIPRPNDSAPAPEQS